MASDEFERLRKKFEDLKERTAKLEEKIMRQDPYFRVLKARASRSKEKERPTQNTRSTPKQK